MDKRMHRNQQGLNLQLTFQKAKNAEKITLKAKYVCIAGNFNLEHYILNSHCCKYYGHWPVTLASDTQYRYSVEFCHSTLSRP